MIVKNNKSWIVSTLNNGSVTEFNEISFYAIKLNVKVCNYRSRWLHLFSSSQFPVESNSALISWVSTPEIVIICFYLEQLSECLSSLPDKHWELVPVCVYCMQAQQLKTFGFGEVEITHLEFHKVKL